MPGNDNVEDWRLATGLGHGQNWGAPTQYPTDGRAWGMAMNQWANSNKSSPVKGLNAAAPSFTPAGDKSKK
jgi:hypothetical protein